MKLRTSIYKTGSHRDMEEQLTARLKNQDQSVIGDIYNAYSGALYSVVLRIVQQRELAQQVLQDTFLKVWRNGTSYDSGKGRLFTWLLNIARNTAIDATRTAHFQNSRKTDNLDGLVYQPSGHAINPEHIGLREAVNAMDEKYRLLLEMIYFRGYTQEEAAEETGIPLGTIKTRLRYAIGELRQAFDA